MHFSEYKGFYYLRNVQYFLYSIRKKDSEGWVWRFFLCLIPLYFCFSLSLCAQQKAVEYTRDFEFKEGVYLSFINFKENNPIPRSKIIFRSNGDDKDFLKYVLDNSTLKYIDSTGKEQDVQTNSIWGYCSNGAVYIYHGTDFNRMVVIGSLCHFVATIAVRTASDPYGYGYNNGFGYNPYPRYVYSTQQFILDFESGNILDFDVERMEEILQRDKGLYEQFELLKKKQKRDSIFLYLRKYNEKHPIYFPE
jgi:hypothetical protein